MSLLRALACVLVALLSSGCANVYSSRPSAPTDDRVAVTALYVMGFAGHDHNHQLIDLRAVMGEGHVLQVLTGSAAKANHPVTDGPGTIFYRLGHGYVRLLVFPDKLLFEMKGSRGRTLYRHAVDARG